MINMTSSIFFYFHFIFTAKSFHFPSLKTDVYLQCIMVNTKVSEGISIYRVFFKYLAPLAGHEFKS